MVLLSALLSHLQLDGLQTGRFSADPSTMSRRWLRGYATSPQRRRHLHHRQLMRVTMLLPIVLIITLIAARGVGKHEPAQKKVALLPGFLIAFVILAALNGFDLVAKTIVSVLTEASRCYWSFGAALGMKTSLREMMAVGTHRLLHRGGNDILALLVLGWIMLLGAAR